MTWRTRSTNLPTYQPTAFNQKPIMVGLWFFTLLKLFAETIKNSKYHLKVHGL